MTSDWKQPSLTEREDDLFNSAQLHRRDPKDLMIENRYRLVIHKVATPLNQYPDLSSILLQMES